MRKVKFRRPWQTYRVGDVIEPTAAFGQTLVMRNICEYVDEMPAILAPARKRGRPKKVA